MEHKGSRHTAQLEVSITEHPSVPVGVALVPRKSGSVFFKANIIPLPGILILEFD